MGGTAREQRMMDILDRAAGPRLLADNPFRVTGLAADVTDREVRAYRQRVSAALSMDAPLPSSTQLIAPFEPAGAEAMEPALGAIEDAERRIAAELFWPWGDGTRDCRCPVSAHVAHDRAVQELVMVTDRQLREPAAPVASPGDLASRWAAVLAAPETWAHIAYRVRELGDRRVDEESVAGLQRAAASAIVQTWADLAVSRRDSAAFAALAEWNVLGTATVDHARDEAVRPLFDRLQRQLDQAFALRDTDIGIVDIERVVGELPVAADELEHLVPSQTSRRAADLRNRAAVVLNNLATSEVGAEAPREVRERWLATAARYATDPSTRETVQVNRDAVRVLPDASVQSGTIPRQSPASAQGAHSPKDPPGANQQVKGALAKVVSALDELRAEPNPDPDTVAAALALAQASQELSAGLSWPALDHLETARRAQSNPRYRRLLARLIRDLSRPGEPIFGTDAEYAQMNRDMMTAWILPVGLFVTWQLGWWWVVSIAALLALLLPIQVLTFGRAFLLGPLRRMGSTWIVLLPLVFVGWISAFFTTSFWYVVLVSTGYWLLTWSVVRRLALRISETLEDR